MTNINYADIDVVALHPRLKKKSLYVMSVLQGERTFVQVTPEGNLFSVIPFGAEIVFKISSYRPGDDHLIFVHLVRNCYFASFVAHDLIAYPWVR